MRKALNFVISLYQHYKKAITSISRRRRRPYHNPSTHFRVNTLSALTATAGKLLICYEDIIPHEEENEAEKCLSTFTCLHQTNLLLYAVKFERLL